MKTSTYSKYQILKPLLPHNTAVCIFYEIVKKIDTHETIIPGLMGCFNAKLFL